MASISLSSLLPCSGHSTSLENSNSNFHKFLHSLSNTPNKSSFGNVRGLQMDEKKDSSIPVQSKPRETEMIKNWKEESKASGAPFSSNEAFLEEGESIDSESSDGKRGIPSIMRCFDTAKIYVKAGDGGNGVVAFRREKYVPMGGPSGGNGGQGGGVYVVCDSSFNSLLPFRRKIHFRAERGTHGQGSKCHGHRGDDVEVIVPPGTLVKQALGKDVDEEEFPVLLEMVKHGQRELLLSGGKGGRGNASFKTGKNNAPQMAEFGEKGEEMWIQLELKLVADIGIIGVPNAGKSTLLSAISKAKPKIANYPFTTLVPNLGVSEIDFESLVFADIPGLLEGASLGVGLGIHFLRHIERCRALVHVIDCTRPQPIYDYEAICNELNLFNPQLRDKPQIIAFNKIDASDSATSWLEFSNFAESKGLDVIRISAVTGEGTKLLIRKAKALLDSIPEPDSYYYENTSEPSVGEKFKLERDAPIENFEIDVDKSRRIFTVMGQGIERFTQMTNWEYFEAMKRFQHVLDSSGINLSLKERGIKDGDVVVIGEMQFDWHDENDFLKSKSWKRGTRGTKVWPH